MKRPILISISIMTLILLLAATAFALRPKQISNFDLHFSATGLVEDIRHQGNRCEVQVAVYGWLNISKGFALTDIPKQDDRYILRGQGDMCAAVDVAMAATGNHIGFEAGEHKGKWYFTENPRTAAGCGGLQFEWTPGPITVMR